MPPQRPENTTCAEEKTERLRKSRDHLNLIHGLHCSRVVTLAYPLHRVRRVDARDNGEATEQRPRPPQAAVQATSTSSPAFARPCTWRTAANSSDSFSGSPKSGHAITRCGQVTSESRAHRSSRYSAKSGSRTRSKGTKPRRPPAFTNVPSGNVTITSGLPCVDGQCPAAILPSFARRKCRKLPLVSTS